MRSETLRLAGSLVLLSWLAAHAGGPASAGIRSHPHLELSNHDFASGLASWTETTGGPSTCFQPHAAPDGPAPALLARVPLGTLTTLANDLPVGGSLFSPSATELGPKTEWVTWVWIPSAGNASASGSVQLRAESIDAANQGTLIASSPVLAVAAAPRNQWIALATRPKAALQMHAGRLLTGAAALRISLQVVGNVQVYFKKVVGGHFEHGLRSIGDPSFESGLSGSSAWSIAEGNAQASNWPIESDAWDGRTFVELTGSMPCAITQHILLAASGASESAPRAFDRLQLGAWIWVEGSASLNGGVELKLIGTSGQGSQTSQQLLASKYFAPTSGDTGRWIFVKTRPGGVVSISASMHTLVLEIRKTLAGTVRVDGVQLGETGGVTGIPHPFVTISWVGLYRSPLYPYTIFPSTDPAKRWRNWFSSFVPVCDPLADLFSHDPDQFRPNGRRDVATSEDEGLYWGPLAGTYDSRDADLIRCQLSLVRAAGFDGVTLDYYGHALAVQRVSQGTDPVNELTLEALLNGAEDEALENSMRVSIMYEPKVAFSGWIAGLPPTFQARKDLIIDDLVYFASQWGDRRALLKRNNAIVVQIFGMRPCYQNRCMEDSDWSDVVLAVKQATGRQLVLIGDSIPLGLDFTDPDAWYPSSMTGMMRWKLVDSSILKYGTFDDVLAHSPSLPHPTAADLEAYADLNNQLVTQWGAQDDKSRLSMAVVWPDFDDSGVGGWGQSNMTGSDAQPLCIRVNAELAGQFHATTAQSAFDAPVDWIQWSSWNDWNETTQLEPVWDAAYESAVLANQTASAPVLQRVFGRLFEAQSRIAELKGLPPGTLSQGAIESVARAYVWSTYFDPSVQRYD